MLHAFILWDSPRAIEEIFSSIDAIAEVSFVRESRADGGLFGGRITQELFDFERFCEIKLSVAGLKCRIEFEWEIFSVDVSEITVDAVHDETSWNRED